MTVVWFGAATFVFGLMRAPWSNGTQPNGELLVASGGFQAISTTLMLGMVFKLPLRQTEGFVRSLVDVMGCELPVPDHTTLSRRRRTVDVVVETSTNKWPTDIVLDSTGLKFFGAGEWARAKHGETRRSWRKLHISVDPASSEIRTHELTGDGAMAGSG